MLALQNDIAAALRSSRRCGNGKGAPLEGNEVHSGDLPETSGPGVEEDGILSNEISNAVVALYKEHGGKGPTRCRTYLQSDLAAVVLGGGYTASEQTLFEDGRWYAVRETRQLWQDSMQARFVEAIERLTGRKVQAFMSANHQDPDLSVELFVLENEQTASA
jgi:uncharacterized protein YbcI